MDVRHRWPVRTRLTFYAGVVAALLCAVLATVIMVSVQRLATERVTEQVIGTTGRVAARDDPTRLSAGLPQGATPDVQVVDERGTVVAASGEMRGKPAMTDLRFPGGRSTATAVVCGNVLGRGECEIVAGQRADRDGRPLTVLSAAPMVPPLVSPLLATTVIGGAVLLAAGLTYGAHRVVAATLGPMHAIRSELDAINATCPGRRVPVPAGDDEISDLAESVNHTLGRLQGAMEQQRRFASDASHDLRSPIAAMRTEIESALLAPEDADWPATGNAVLSGLDRLQAIVGDLLTLARLDAGAPGRRSPVDLAGLVRTEMDSRHRVKSIHCELADGVLVLGDNLRLARLVTNLVDNAERHADRAITIKVCGMPPDPGDPRFAHGTAVLEVIDDGAGIPPDEREAVFQRFIRLDAARKKDPSGTGLGLAIARQIADMAGGTLTIQDSPRGARFVLRLPRVPQGTRSSPPPAPDRPDRLG